VHARHRVLGNHRGLAATVVTGILALSGVTSIGVAVAHHPGLPQVPLTAADSSGFPAREVSDNREAQLAGATPKVVGPVMRTSTPVTLAIPAIGVRSSLLRLGQTTKGAMQTPSGRNYDKAGWYRYSPTPGSLGPAVIAGHVDSAKDGPSVFFRLGSLRRNDPILITRADGSVAAFTVDSINRYAKDRFPSKLVYGDTNRAALRLITCGGVFDRGSGNYVDNIVVFASLLHASSAQQPPASRLPD